ncbi:protein PAT1 homolog 1 isoform X2 [Macrosteles quadrilineatus]|uniref:protein PAT1 homolog 1 isoform X2 n=1 Tax=Macrosteles quadrilineatus TaxID=74068 RepID=UPI0023E34BF4|nr:protein PAT1 homolog 1 isoform X2 [Macrosteles quadrilineatus]
MSDFFDFNTSMDKTFEEFDDTDYDALNSETFGPMDTPDGDWEETHEQFAMNIETPKEPKEDKSNEMEQMLASLTMNCIFDEDLTELRGSVNGSSQQPPAPSVKAVPSSPWANNLATNTTGVQNFQNNQMKNTSRDFWPPQHPAPSTPSAGPGNNWPPPRMPTVEEIESMMMTKSDPQKPLAPSAASVPPSIENENRNLITRSGHHNGNFAGVRGGAIPRHPQPPYHAVHHPYGYTQGMQPHLMPNQPRGSQGHSVHNIHNHPLMRPTVQCKPQRYSDWKMPFQRQQQQNNLPPQYQNTNQHQQFGRVPPYQPTDEWAGLMSPQEKQWLASIQMLQLNTHQPFRDDYYFTVYQQRHGSGKKIAGPPNQKRDNLGIAPQKQNTYTPLQFENSLGKLQIGSVTAPRKIIDMVYLDMIDSNTKQQNERKSKAILMEIEKMYSQVIKIEDSYNTANVEKDKVDIVDLQTKLMNSIACEGNERKLAQIMSVKKGKKLVLRMLPMLLTPAKLLQTLMKDLPSITRKDSEHNMLLFLPAIRSYLQGIDLKTLVEITTEYDNLFLLSNKFTISVVANLILRADEVKDQCSEPNVLTEWNNFLIRTLEATRNMSNTERPVIAVERSILVRHLMPVKDQVNKSDIEALMQLLQPANTSARVPSPEEI